MTTLFRRRAERELARLWTCPCCSLRRTDSSPRPSVGRMRFMQCATKNFDRLCRNSGTSQLYRRLVLRHEAFFSSYLQTEVFVDETPRPPQYKTKPRWITSSSTSWFTVSSEVVVVSYQVCPFLTAFSPVYLLHIDSWIVTWYNLLKTIMPGFWIKG